MRTAGLEEAQAGIKIAGMWVGEPLQSLIGSLDLCPMSPGSVRPPLMPTGASGSYLPSPRPVTSPLLP